MDSGKIKIIKAKNFADGVTENPNGKVLNFRLVDGCKFIADSGWHYE